MQILLAAGAEPDPLLSEHDEPVLTRTASVEVFAALLDAGARVQAVLPHNRSILREVAGRRNRVSISDRIEMLKLMQVAGIDVNATHAGGGTALGHLSMDGDAGGVEALLAVGADPSVGRNPLISACFAYNAERDPAMERTIALLVAAGVDKNGPDPRVPPHPLRRL